METERTETWFREQAQDELELMNVDVYERHMTNEEQATPCNCDSVQESATEIVLVLVSINLVDVNSPVVFCRSRSQVSDSKGRAEARDVGLHT